MKLAALLNWYDEEPAELMGAVRSLAGLADEIIAADGAYAQFPHEDAVSDPAQVHAILQAASQAGMGCTVHRPATAWPGECVKRTALLHLGAARADYVMWLDADERVRPGDFDRARAQIEAMESPVGRVAFHTVDPGPDRWTSDDSRRYVIAQWEAPGKTTYQRRVYRVIPGMEITMRHWFLSGLVDGERRALLFKDPRYPFQQAAHKLDLQIDHYSLARPPARLNRKADYYAARDASIKLSGVEI